MNAVALTIRARLPLTMLAVAALRGDATATTGLSPNNLRTLPTDTPRRALCHHNPRSTRRPRAAPARAVLWARESCEALLDPSPPAWWSRVDAGIGAAHVDAGRATGADATTDAPADAAVPNSPEPFSNYVPFCSLYAYRSFEADDPRARRAELTARAQSWTYGNNACLAAPNGDAPLFAPSELQLMEGAEDLSRGIPPAPSEDRRRPRRLHVRSYIDQILAIKAEARMRCCNGVGARHRTCQAIFDRTPVLPCVPGRSDEGFGECVRGAYYTTILHRTWDGSIFRIGLSGAIAQGHTRIGRITVAPLVLPDGTPYDNVFVIRHELGHLCSDALRHSMMLSGVREAHDELYEWQGQGSQDEGEQSLRCVLTPATESVYRQLWRDLGIEEASYLCLADAIRRLPCTDRCPRSLMEEAFADWFAMQLTPSPERIPHIFPNACFGLQDTQHLFFGTVMACLARSANARAFLEDSLQCRRAAPRPSLGSTRPAAVAPAR